MENKIKVFSENNKYLSDNERRLIDEYINKIPEEKYEEKFNTEVTTNEIMHLSLQPQNLINWNPNINSNSTVLQVGGNLGEITSVLCQKSKFVTVIEPNYEKGMAISKRTEKYENLEILIGSINEIDISKKYDVIFIIDFIPRIEEIFGEKIDFRGAIKKLENYLNITGKFIWAVDNKYGLKYFIGHPENVYNKKFLSLLGYSSVKNKVETFTKSTIEQKLSDLGYTFRFYYPLPDFRLPNVIFSDEQLPDYTNIDKYYPYMRDNTDILINEVDLFREILKDNPDQFTFFANSYLVEFSKSSINDDYKYISFNNLRKREYRLITKISDKYVEKQWINSYSKEHYENMKKNIVLMHNNNINTVDYIADGFVRSKYIDRKYMLENVLINDILSNNMESFYEKINRYYEELKNNSYQINDFKKTVFDKYDIEVKIPIDGLHFLSKGLWDMTFTNSFYIENKFCFFDQEWEEDSIPAEYILYRAITYSILLRKYINIQELMNKFGLNIYQEIFNQLDIKLQEKIRDERMWTYYSQNYYFDIDSTKQEMINMGIRSKAKDGAIENLQKEINDYKLMLENKQKETEKLIAEKNNLNLQINNMMFSKIKRRIKRILGGNHE